MKRVALMTGILTACAFASSALPVSAAEHQHHHHAPAASTPADANALKDEMRRLDKVFQEIVSAVSLGDADRVKAAVEFMHGAKEKTQEAVHKGEVKTPKNTGKMDEFVKIDNAFHKNLESLVGAAGKNDQKKMAEITKKLLDGCVSCHQKFRK